MEASRPSLDLDETVWKIGEASFAHIAGLIQQINAGRMLEFGSGTSTVRWALEFPQLHVTSLEHVPEFCTEVGQLVHEHGVAGRVQIQCLALQYVWLDGRPFRSYAPPLLEGQYDIVLIDGPPAYATRGREICLYFSYDHLRVGGLVVLDDVKRKQELRVLANWLDVYPHSFEVQLSDSDHGLAILRKTKHERRRMLPPIALADSYLAQALAQVRRLRQ